MWAGSLLPGALVNVRVRSVLSDGLIVSFLTYFTGTVDPFHVTLVSCPSNPDSSVIDVAHPATLMTAPVAAAQVTTYLAWSS